MEVGEAIVRPLLAYARFLREGGLPRLMAVLDGDGEETRLVGGAVRNALMGLPLRDIDLATTALPATIVARAAAAGLRTVPTGIDHGTVTVLVGREPFEVTTLRADIETDGRHAKVRFGRSFAEDARRRDFTMNALFATADGTVTDYTGGIADIAARRVRFIGEAEQRIREDYLRVLRFFRFHAVYGAGPIDPAGFAASIRERRGLAALSRERVWGELSKLLVAPGAAHAVEAMSGAGLLGPLVGGVVQAGRLERLAEIEAARGDAADPVTRLAGLAVNTIEDADRLRDLLRLSNEAHARLLGAARVLAALYGRPGAPAAADLTRVLFLEGRQAARDGTLLAQAGSAAPPDDPVWSRALDYVAGAPRPTLPFTGAEIVRRGVAAGPSVGRILKTLQAGWIRAGFPGDPAVLARLLDEAVALAAESGIRDSSR